MDMKLSLLLSIYSVILIHESNAYKPVYVPYIFQLYGDRPSKNTKTVQIDRRIDKKAATDKVLKEEKKGELADLRLKGTGKPKFLLAY